MPWTIRFERSVEQLDRARQRSPDREDLALSRHGGAAMPSTRHRQVAPDPRAGPGEQAAAHPDPPMDLSRRPDGRI
jgi:hypothetical protein